MTDYTDLQKAAEYAAQDTIKFADEDEEMRALQQFHEEVDPETVLALITENQRLGLKADSLEFAKWSCQVNEQAIRAAGHETIEDLAEERDQLKAEFAGLKTGYEAYERVNAELRAENEELRMDADRFRRMRAMTLAQIDDTQDEFDAEFDRQLDAAMGKGERS